MGILGSTTHASRSQSDRVFSTGRCPFPKNIGRRVVVPAVRGPTPCAGPDAITQRDMVVDMATSRAQFGGRKPGIKMMHNRPCFRRDMMQHLHKCTKAQIGDLATPPGFHTLEIERLEGQVVILCTEIVCQVPVERVSHMGHTFMHTGQMPLCPSAVL